MMESRKFEVRRESINILCVFAAQFAFHFFACQSTLKAQSPASEECGATAAFMACCTFVPSVQPYKDFVAKLGPVGKGGYSFEQIEKSLNGENLHTLAIETTLESLRLRAKQQQFLAIVRLDLNHFVLVTRLESNSVEFVDFPRIEVQPDAVFLSRWRDRKAMLVSDQVLLPVGGSAWIWVIFFVFVAPVFFIGSKFMRRKTSRAMTILIFCCFFGCEGKSGGKTSLTKDTEPIVSISPSIIQLGLVKPGTESVATALITNNGKTPVRIARISKSCSCMDVVLDRTTIAAGDSCNLKVSLMPIRSSNSTELRIVLSEPANKEISLPIFWDSSQGIRLGTDGSIVHGSVNVGGWMWFKETVIFDPKVAPCELSDLIFEGDSIDCIKVDFDQSSMALNYAISAFEVGQFQAAIRALDQDSNILMEKAVLWKVVDPNEIVLVNGPVKTSERGWEAKILVLAASIATPEDFILATVPETKMNVSIEPRNNRSWWFVLSSPLSHSETKLLKVIVSKRVGMQEIAKTELSFESNAHVQSSKKNHEE